MHACMHACIHACMYMSNMIIYYMHVYIYIYISVTCCKYMLQAAMLSLSAGSKRGVPACRLGLRPPEPKQHAPHPRKSELGLASQLGSA